MKKIISFIGTLIFVWVIYVLVEYNRCYIGESHPFMGYVETGDGYVKRGGLGFYYVDYVIPDDERKDGDVLKAFYVIKWPVHKQKVIVVDE